MSSTETSILVTGIAATLQLCRLAMDLIATASQKDAAVTQKLDAGTAESRRQSPSHSSSSSNKPMVVALLLVSTE